MQTVIVGGKMNKFGKCAINAVTLYHNMGNNDPIEAWKEAVKHEFKNSESSREKGCPREAFLGLCEKGLIIGIQAGNYTNSKENKKYAIKAINILKNNSGEDLTPNNLWKKVMSPNTKTHNRQMDVVKALWDSNLINKDLNI
jgi:hypothetical protein